MPERYTRPPLVAGEPRSCRAARWRFHVVMLVVLALIVVAAVLGYRALSGATRQDPGVTGVLGWSAPV